MMTTRIVSGRLDLYVKAAVVAQLLVIGYLKAAGHDVPDELVAALAATVGLATRRPGDTSPRELAQLLTRSQTVHGPRRADAGE